MVNSIMTIRYHNSTTPASIHAALHPSNLFLSCQVKFDIRVIGQVSIVLERVLAVLHRLIAFWASFSAQKSSRWFMAGNVTV
jgi:hypothetical protein